MDFIGTRFIILQEGAVFMQVAKGIKLFVVVVMSVVLFERKIVQPLYGVLLLGGIALLGQLILQYHGAAISWMELFRIWMLYGGGIVMAFFFQSLYLACTPRSFDLVLRLTQGVICVVCLSIIIGFIFDITLFKTYRGGLRFGYTGLLHKSVAATYFFIGSICLSYYYTYLQQKWSSWFFCLILICSFLVGTKGIYLFNGLLFLYTCWNQQWYKKRAFYGGIALVGLGITFLVHGVIGKNSTTVQVFSSIYKEHGMLTALMSFRNEMLVDKGRAYFEQWDIGNYFFGGKLPELGLFEMSLFDLYSFFGGFGLIYVLFLYYKSSVILYVGNKAKQYIYFCYLSVLIISIFAGQLFVNFSSLFFILWVMFLINNGEIVKK